MRPAPDAIELRHLRRVRHGRRGNSTSADPAGRRRADRAADPAPGGVRRREQARAAPRPGPGRGRGAAREVAAAGSRWASSEGEHAADQGAPGDRADDPVHGHGRDVGMQRLLEPADGGVGLGSEDAVDLQAQTRDRRIGSGTGTPPAPRAPRRLGCPCFTWTINADQVFGPTMPSTDRSLSCWNARTAPSVFGPKIPSTVTWCPRARSRYCRVCTGCCWSPFLTSGHGPTEPAMTTPRRTSARFACAVGVFGSILRLARRLASSRTDEPGAVRRCRPSCRGRHPRRVRSRGAG